VTAPVPCTTCGTLIFFAVTEKGKKMPVDYESSGREGGTLGVRKDGETMRCRVLPSPPVPGPGEKLGTSHYVTCNRPDDHRRR
jgi:hypothetical protein